MASDVWQALGLARQTGIEYWPGESVHYRGQLATVTRAVSTPRISVSWDAQGVTVGALVRATAYDVQLVSGEILTAVGPADLERDAKRAAIDYLRHEHTPERTRPARRSAE